MKKSGVLQSVNYKITILKVNKQSKICPQGQQTLMAEITQLLALNLLQTTLK